MSHSHTGTAPTPRGSASPWHAGERSIHQRMGNTEQMESLGRRVIRDYMPEQHRAFYQQLPFMVLGAVDAQGRPWATLLEGEPGFMHAPDARSLAINAQLAAGDPLREALRGHTAVGLLGIELHTRRRNRLNGHTTGEHQPGAGLLVTVDQSFGNCPQYIQKRNFHFAHPLSQAFTGAVESFSTLDAEARATIAAADTFFVASQFPGDAELPEPSVDVSHRGGKPGFVRVQGNTLHIPDFAGNMHFNTLGNLILNPRAGLVFIDFQSGDMLQLSGTAQVVFEGPEISAFQGAERMWTFTAEHVVRRRKVLALRWSLEEISPNSRMTGSWADAHATLEAAALQTVWRPFTVAKIVEESSQVRSLYLAPQDGYAAPAFQAGQHLPIRLSVPGQHKPVLRHYTLSAAPSDGFLRISVKRQGLVSRHLHDAVGVGDVIEARSPQGGFTIEALERRPAVLMAAGIGITPMLAMLRHIVFEGLRKRRIRPTVLFYATRTHAERAFEAELAELRQRAGTALRVVRVLSQPETALTEGLDYDASGHIDMALLKSVLPFDDHDFYLCGPTDFMQASYDGLRQLGVRDQRIHAEAFGPAALQRSVEGGATRHPLPAAAVGSVPVFFSTSGKEARWTPATGSLLDLAEQRGLEPAFSCRTGSCGTCRTTVLEGQVTYATQPAFATEPAQALVCCAMPAQAADGTVSRLVLAL